MGQVIDDKYEILKLIGKGGMSKVYLAMDRRLNKQWAIKEIEKRVKDRNNEIVIQSAIAEANMIKQLDHPAIVRIVDIIDNGNVIYIIEDYIEGETLGTILETNGPQPQNLVIDWAIQLCEALEYLHTRKPPIIYRDMKPANVMLKPDGSVKVIDFGIAREYKEQNLADTRNLGTEGYAAPEQFGGKGQTDPRTDVYCLGATLHHLITGQNPNEPPYERYPIRHWNPQLSAGLEAIIQKCTQLNPDDRYQSCAELLYALKHYEEYGAVYRAKQKQKLKIFSAVAITSFVLAVVGAFSLIMRLQTNNADYSLNIIQAQNVSSFDEKMDYYEKAIDIKPTEYEAYYEMIKTFKENDSVFSEDEEKILIDKVNENITALREKEDYASFAYEIGKLYWYYYDYGNSESDDNQLTRMKSAIQWFEDAVQFGSPDDSFYNVATVYRDIGKFNRDIVLDNKEASDAGKYYTYWNNMQNLLTILNDNKNESEIVKVEVYRLCLNSIETYARKFEADGVTENSMNLMYDNVCESLNNLVTTPESEPEKIKNEIIGRLDSDGDGIIDEDNNVKQSIENAYRE